MASDDSSSSAREPVIRLTGRQVVVTRTELRLWQVLAGQPGRIFTRSELTALVMPDSPVNERTIDVHIHNLRKKLGETEEGQVEAVRKKGYRWAPKEP